MKKIILGIALVSLVLFSVQSSYGYTVTFEKRGPILKEVPTVCIIEPDYNNSKILSESFAKRMMDQTRISINEWKVLLQNSERGRDKSMWDIKQIPISLDQQQGFDYDQCQIFIKFEEKPESKDEWYKLLGKTQYEVGDTGRSYITIYYDAIKYCKTEDKDWIYFDPCYEDFPRLMQQIQSVVKHEFGHALGLGHYQADDINVSVGWARGTIPAPSIMAVFSHQNLNANVITTKDIVAVRSMYGENGFLPDEEKPEVFDSFQTSSELYLVPKGGFTTSDVEGQIKKDQYIAGVPVDITITDPNQEIKTRKARVNSDGAFGFQTVIDDTTLNGTYTVYATYRDQKSEEVAFDIQYQVDEQESKIPLWLKNSVQWWAEDKANEVGLISGIEHLINVGMLEQTSLIKGDLGGYEAQSIGIKVPKYFKQTSLWWTEGKITDREFVDGIQYLMDHKYLVI